MQNPHICWHELLFCEHQSLWNHHPTWLFRSPKKGNTVNLVSLACMLYCELDVTIKRVRMLVEMFCICFLQTYDEVIHITSPPLSSNWRGRQALFLYVGHDKICKHCADWWPYWTTKYLLVVHLMSTNSSKSITCESVKVAVSFHPSNCQSFVFTMSVTNLTGMEVKSDRTSKDKFLIFRDLLVECKTLRTRLCSAWYTGYPLVKVPSTFAKYLDTWYVGVLMQLFIGLRGTRLKSSARIMKRSLFGRGSTLWTFRS